MNTRELLPEGILGNGEHMYVYVLSYRHTDALELRVIFFFLIPFICVSLCACLPLTIYIPTLPAGPIVTSLASMVQSSTLKKCKAADQSGLERQCTRRPLCLSSPPVSPAHCVLMFPAGGRGGCVKDMSV